MIYESICGQYIGGLSRFIIIPYKIEIKKPEINKKITIKNFFLKKCWIWLAKYIGKKINNNLTESEKIKFSVLDFIKLSLTKPKTKRRKKTKKILFKS